MPNDRRSIAPARASSSSANSSESASVGGTSRGTVSFVTLGCSKNEVDSEVMAGILAHAGYTIAPEGTLGNVVLVNTCAFIDAAKEESIDEILGYARLKEEGRIEKLVVTGCLVQRYGAEVAREIPEVDLFLGTTNLDLVAQGLDRVRLGERVVDLAERGSYIGPLMLERVRLARGVSAPLKIAEGCSKRCAFCAIPTFRGDLASRPIESIVDEARLLVSQGVRELLVISQDTTSYGQDLYGRPRLTNLLTSLAAVPGVGWIRLHYNHPAHFDEELLTVFAETPQLCRYIDMPVQHASDPILKAMNRGTTRERLRTLLLRTRDRLPDAAIRTTFLLGFPGETDADFEAVLDLVEEVRFERVGIFLFSPQDGTPAEAMKRHVPAAVAEERHAALRELADEISLETNSARIGREVTVLIEGRDHNGRLFGRTEWDAPEVDGLALLSGAGEPGNFATAHVTGATTHDITAEIIVDRPSAVVHPLVRR
ncbi:MAG: 30S ribosomal protein S12 methylthiotransferase RimO [bacterium]